MPTTQIAPILIQSFRDSNGNPLAGGSLYTYTAGTSTPQATYIDQTGNTANANPVVLNSRGEAPVWLTIGQTYKFVLYDAFSTLIYSVDQVTPTTPSGTPQTLAASGITGAAASGANADITSLVGPVSTVNGATLMHFNDIINGNFTVAQAGASFPAAINGTYDLDGWLNNNTSTAVFTVAQAPGSTSGRMARQVTITTAKPSIAAGDIVSDQTRIEGYNIEKYVGNTFTLGFRARVPVAGIHCVALRNVAADRSYVAEVNFLTANVMQNCSVTVVGGLPTTGPWNYVNGVGLTVDFARMTGTTFMTSPNVWQTGNFLATANQVNDCATLSNAWSLEKVTLNLGTVASVNEISTEQETIRCIRYFEIGFIRSDGYNNAGSQIGTMITYKSNKRISPTVTGVNIVFSNAATFAVDANSDVSGFQGKATVTATGPAAFTGTWTASARL